MANLEEFEVARGMLQQGMELLGETEYGTTIHPIGALAVVRNVLIIPAGSPVESLDVTHVILNKRLRQPEALTYQQSWGKSRLERMQRAFVALNPPQYMTAIDHSRMWEPAMEIIQKPIEEAEAQNYME